MLLLDSEDSSPRVVIPSALRSEVLKLLHADHWGVSRTKALARRHVFWPGLASDVSRMVTSCSLCAQHQASPRATFAPWPQPSQAWDRLHIDFAGPFLNAYWLLVIDAFSKFPYVVRCLSTSATATVAALSRIFSIEGTTVLSLFPASLPPSSTPEVSAMSWPHPSIRSQMGRLKDLFAPLRPS